MLQITTQRTTTPKAKPDESNLGFGVHYTDHMLIIDHDEEQGWHDARASYRISRLSLIRQRWFSIMRWSPLRV